jgi:hypothetical protein
MACELVITGWYSSDRARNYVTFGDDSIRSAEFRPLWWRSLDTFVQPQHVLIVDSASPIKPNDAAYTASKLQHLELLINPGHSQNGRAHYCGYMSSVILGMEFALQNDVGMVLYVEQDALVFGEHIVARTKNALRSHDLVFGGRQAGTDIQQSFFAANKKGIRRFLAAMHAIDYSDRQIAPEHKFMVASSKRFPAFLAGLASWDNPTLIRRANMRLFLRLCQLTKNYALLPFGYGRDRPIDFSDELFYFQQASAEEIVQYKTLTGF